MYNAWKGGIDNGRSKLPIFRAAATAWGNLNFCNKSWLLLLLFTKQMLTVVVVYQTNVDCCCCLPNKCWLLLLFTKQMLTVVKAYQTNVDCCCYLPNKCWLLLLFTKYERLKYSISKIELIFHERHQRNVLIVLLKRFNKTKVINLKVEPLIIDMKTWNFIILRKLSGFY